MFTHLSKRVGSMEEPSNLHQRLARTVRRLRDERSWSQEELAARCGLHRTYIGAIERGEYNVTVNTLEKIAHSFGSKAWKLLRESDDISEQAG